MYPERLDPYTGKPAKFLFTAKDNRAFPGSFNYYEADGHVFLDNVPEDLARHYGGGYQRIPATEAELAKIASEDAYRLDLINQVVEKGDFLEIGPWIGLVAYTALKAGYRVSALEMDQECVDLMNSVGINATQTADPATALSESGLTYDVIGLWHSIEHIPEPWKVIDAAAKALNPGGLLVIAAPNPQSAQFKVFKENWYHLDAPRHLHLIPATTYEQIGKDNGLRTLTLTCDDQLGCILDQSGWDYETHRWVKHVPILRSLSRRLFSKQLQRKYRPHRRLDGAAFTLAMLKPVDA